MSISVDLTQDAPRARRLGALERVRRFRNAYRAALERWRGMNPTHGQGMNPPAVPLQYLLDRLRIRPWVGTSFTTEILDGPTAYYADDYHQLYLHKNPGGYCGINGTGVNCPIGTGA